MKPVHHQPLCLSLPLPSRHLFPTGYHLLETVRDIGILICKRPVQPTCCPPA